MSKIVEISKCPPTFSRSREIVNVQCVYEKGYLSDNTPCVILKTYNPDSKKAGISQTLHITPDTAKKLVEIFKKELGI